jgi:hypothetical protein
VPTARKGTKTGEYRSKYEAKLAPALEAAGAEYEAEQLTYQLERVYKPDWRTKAGVIIEIKGYFPAEDRGKMRAVKAAHPGRDIRIVFQNANTKLTKKSKTTYAQWAEKHGFAWAHGEVPASWLQ